MLLIHRIIVTLNKKFNNNAKGFEQFLSWINKLDDVYVCLEATGIYGFNIAQYLHQHNIKVMVINPIIIHAFFKVELSRNKTDKADAQLIARYCEYVIQTAKFDAKAYRPKSVDYEAIQRLVTRCDQLEKSKTQESNRLEAHTNKDTSNKDTSNKDTSRSIKRLQKMINDEIIKVKKTIAKIVKSNKILSHQVALITSIKGIGERTAWSILAYIGDINLFTNSKQITSYAGLSPRIIQSGTSINKSSLSKLGHKRLRKLLYMPALVAIRHNSNLKAVYERLINNGKPKKVAIVAVMRKLLVLPYGVLKSEKVYDENYQIAS